MGRMKRREIWRRSLDGGLSAAFSANFVELICDQLCLTKKVVADYES
jgi:hypothetical protein